MCRMDRRRAGIALVRVPDRATPAVYTTWIGPAGRADSDIRDRRPRSSASSDPVALTRKDSVHVSRARRESARRSITADCAKHILTGSTGGSCTADDSRPRGAPSPTTAPEPSVRVITGRCLCRGPGAGPRLGCIEFVPASRSQPFHRNLARPRRRYAVYGQGHHADRVTDRDRATGATDGRIEEDVVVQLPNILFFHVDNLGFGELSCFSGGPFRGTWTRRIDAFASQGIRLTNYAPEAQCTPTRSALLTGRYAIRSGNHSVPLSRLHRGLVVV